VDFVIIKSLPGNDACIKGPTALFILSVPQNILMCTFFSVEKYNRTHRTGLGSLGMSVASWVEKVGAQSCNFSEDSCKLKSMKKIHLSEIYSYSISVCIKKWNFKMHSDKVNTQLCTIFRQAHFFRRKKILTRRYCWTSRYNNSVCIH